jgi:hypothetical protein
VRFDALGFTNLVVLPSMSSQWKVLSHRCAKKGCTVTSLGSYLDTLSPLCKSFCYVILPHEISEATSVK